MGVKISELTSATSLTGSEELPIVQAGNTKKATIQQVRAINYSTTEQVVGTWIDGKPLYRKIMTGTIPTTSANGTYSNITADIADNIDFAYIELQIAQRTDNVIVNFPRVYMSFSPQAYTQSNCSITSAKKLQVSNTTTELNAGTYYVWVYYTKTTDTATRGGEQLRTMNTGSLVGSGEKSNLLGNFEDVIIDDTKEESKIEEVKEETPLEEKTEAKESGENDELR